MEDAPDSTVSLTARFGEEKLRRRLNLEKNIRSARSPASNWIEAIAWRLQPYGLIEAFLRAFYLWNRGYRNFHNLRVVESPVVLKRLPPELHGFRILQLSDLHIDLDRELIRYIRKRLSGIAYDLVVITGDFQNGNSSNNLEVVELIKDLLPSFQPPIFAVLGNHDTFDLVHPLEKLGIRFLLNESVTITRNDVTFALGGVDDSYFFQTDDIPRAFEGVAEDQVKVLLSHAPSNYQEAEAAGVDYFLCGHTHGGQICLPGGRVVIQSGRVPPELIAGRWKVHGMHGYTSRGTGGCHLPIRFNCPGEITLHTLKSPEASK